MLASTAPVAWRATRPVSRVMLRPPHSKDLRMGFIGITPGWTPVLAGRVRMIGSPPRRPIWRGQQKRAPAATGGGGPDPGSAGEAETLAQAGREAHSEGRGITGESVAHA